MPVRASVGANLKAGTSAAKKTKPHANDRARLRYHNGFKDYKWNQTSKSVRLRQDISDNF